LEATINHLQNLTAISVKNINAAVAEAMAKSYSDNKTVHDYRKDLKDIKNKNPAQLTSTNNVFISDGGKVRSENCI
jgi:hypothetical protein